MQSRNLPRGVDIDGVAFGQEMMAMGRETKAVSDMWPSPRAGALTRGADQVCGVG